MIYQGFISEFYYGTFHFDIKNELLFQQAQGHGCWIALKVSIDFHHFHKSNIF